MRPGFYPPQAATALASDGYTVNRFKMPTIFNVLVANGEGFTSFASPPRCVACRNASTIAPIPHESTTGMASRSSTRKTWPLANADCTALSNWLTGSPILSGPFNFNVQMLPLCFMSRSTDSPVSTQNLLYIREGRLIGSSYFRIRPPVVLVKPDRMTMSLPNDAILELSSLLLSASDSAARAGLIASAVVEIFPESACVIHRYRAEDEEAAWTAIGMAGEVSVEQHSLPPIRG